MEIHVKPSENEKSLPFDTFQRKKTALKTLGNAIDNVLIFEAFRPQRPKPLLPPPTVTLLLRTCYKIKNYSSCSESLLNSM